MSRVLAHVEKVVEIKPVFLAENSAPAENIEMARVLGWDVVVKKNEFKLGELAVYIETDSKLPADNPEFAFLEKRGYKIKAMKLNKFYAGTNPDSKVISQGILFPMSILPKQASEGTDVTEMLKIVKVEDETKEPTVNIDNVMKNLSKKHWFLKTKLGKFLMRYNWFRNFVKRRLLPHFREKKYPTYIVKTDETRIQALPRVFETYKGKILQATEKIDGTSSTFGLEKVGKNKFDFAVCSRNVRQMDKSQKTWYMDSEVNYYWEMADKYDIRNVLERLFVKLNAKNHVYIQGETVGPSIQGNKYKLEERELYAFNLVVDGKKLDSLLGKRILAEENMKWVPIVSESFVLLEGIPEMLEFANAKSVLYDTLREGVVIRDAENTVSFKVISPEFMIKHSL